MENELLKATLREILEVGKAPITNEKGQTESLASCHRTKCGLGKKEYRESEALVNRKCEADGPPERNDSRRSGSIASRCGNSRPENQAPRTKGEGLGVQSPPKISL